MRRPEGLGGAQPGARSKGGSLPPPPAPRRGQKKNARLFNGGGIKQHRRVRPMVSVLHSYVFFIIGACIYMNDACVHMFYVCIHTYFILYTHL